MVRKTSVLVAALIAAITLLYLANVSAGLPTPLENVFSSEWLDWAREPFTEVLGEVSNEVVTLVFIMSVLVVLLPAGVYVSMQTRIETLESRPPQTVEGVTETTSRDIPVLRAQGLRKIYKMGKIDVEALRGLDIEVSSGEYVAILGPSGSGKSTLLNMLGALDKPTDGRVFIDGVDVSTLNDDKLARIRRRKIGFVFQFFALMPRMTALQNVELSLSIAGVGGSARRKRAAELLEIVGLGDRMNHRPTELSGGEQQRVAIARALSNNPSYVLLDEPSGNLDQATGQEIAELLNELNENQGTTFVVVTHDPKMAQEADRILQMMDGEIVKEVSGVEAV